MIKKLLFAFLLACSLTIPSYAQDDLIEVPFFSNTGGLNSKSSPLSLQDNESSDCQNVYFGIDDAIIKRGGSVATGEHLTSFWSVEHTTSEHTVTGLYQFVKNDNTKYLITCIGPTVWKMDSLDGTQDHITGAAVSLTSGELNDFETLGNVLISTDGDDLPWQWNGTGSITALTVPANLTDAKYVRAFHKYLFLGNVVVSGTKYPSRIYYSNLDDITTWGASDYINISTNDGQEITGMAVLGERLVIFKNKSIYNILFTGQSDSPFYVQKSDSDVGCVAGHSIQNVKNNLAFLSIDGLYLYDGVGSVKISDKIDTTLKGYNFSRYDDVSSANYTTRNQIWWAFANSGDSKQNRVIVWDYYHNAFVPYKGLECASMAIIDPDSGAPRLYTGDYNGGVDRQDYGTTDCGLDSTSGSAIESYYWSKWFHLGSLTYQKLLHHLFFITETSGNWYLNVDYAYDLDEGGFAKTQSYSLYGGGSVVGSAVVGTSKISSSEKIVRRLDFTGQARFVRVGFSNKNANETFQVDGFSLIGKKGFLAGATE